MLFIVATNVITSQRPNVDQLERWLFVPKYNILPNWVIYEDTSFIRQSMKPLYLTIVFLTRSDCQGMKVMAFGERNRPKGPKPDGQF